MTLTTQQHARSARRSVLLMAGLIGSLALWWTVEHNTVRWDGWLIAGSLLLGLGLIGRRKDKPIVGHAVQVQRAPRLTSTTVTDALASIGVKPDQVSFAAPITRDGPGWRADVDLPLGVTAADIMGKRAELASGLRRPVGCVWPEPDHAQHAGRLVLWVGDQAMNEARQPPWPLARSGQADLFRPVPFGHDQRGRLVTVTLMYAAVLIGAMPRYGKTFGLRVLLLAAALDPRAELRVFELKGTGDLGPLEPVAHHYASGAGDDAVEDCMASLREVHGMLEPRARTIRGLPRERCPESKVTPELAGQRRLGLFPVVLAVDEAQMLFSHPAYGREAGDLCTDMVKRGPALGIVLLLATQRPDADSLPKGISDNVGIRFCLRVMGHTPNDMVLGTGMYRNGIRATMFTARDKGIGYLLGDADDPQIVRTSYIDGPQAERIVTRARALRKAAGTLTGYAVGEQTFDRGPDFSVVSDLLMVFGPDERQAHSADLVGRLAALRPSLYGGWDATTLAAALEPCGVDTKQVRAGSPSRNARGVVRDDLVDAAGRQAPG